DGGDHARAHVSHDQPPFHRQPRVTRSFRRKTNGAPGPAKSGPMHQQPNDQSNEEKNWSLRRDTKPAFLAKEQERGGEISEGVHALRNRLGEPAKERKSSQRYNQRREAQTRDQGGIQG